MIIVFKFVWESAKLRTKLDKIRDNFFKFARAHFETTPLLLTTEHQSQLIH